MSSLISEAVRDTPVVTTYFFIFYFYLFNPQLDTIQKHITVQHTSASMQIVRHQGRALTDE